MKYLIRIRSIFQLYLRILNPVLTKTSVLTNYQIKGFNKLINSQLHKNV